MRGGEGLEGEMVRGVEVVGIREGRRESQRRDSWGGGGGSWGISERRRGPRGRDS